MFNPDDLIKDCLINPDQTWSRLDSIWREHTTPDTKQLLHLQSWASLLLELNVHARSTYLRSGYDVPHIQPWCVLPWYPIVLYRDRLSDVSFVLYGDPYLYSPVPQIYYGEAGDPQYVYPLPYEVIDVPEITNAVLDPTVVLDKSQYTFDQQTGKLTFSVDPFDLIPAKVDAGSGREYVILWVRNILFDLNMPFDQAGWVVKYDQTYRLSYTDGLKAIWDLVLRGPSVDRYQQGLMAAVGLPYALAAGQVQRVDDDGAQWVVSTADRSYTMLKAQVSPVVAPGDELVVGQPLSDGIKFLDYQALQTVSAADVPGLVLQIPLSTGVSATLSFANVTTAWTFDALRPSPWRFPIGGSPEDVEQFWVDVDTYATANSIDFATLYSLPAAVNPMLRIINDLLQNSVYVVALDLQDMPRPAGTYHDRARRLLPSDILLVLQQGVDDASDTYDTATSTSETVYYGYNAAAPTEVMSVSGTDLTYNDLTPLVVTY